ncbi:hypothetical protein RHGRI_022862 [Rhododendron griersonianum]|uniref:Uncharacterized protein n=1 Tax=Rhododendron griersonianum TaxID=479676 RepID=A0AAV6J3P3_9ERIC|nr:hypothetical protein RHGRI_022862 [Rhododendron griersonianum]
MEPPQQPPKPHFSLPVDADHKATEFRLFSLSPPHMLAFHLSWLSLFSNFFSTFSIPPLLSYIRSDLELSSTDIGYGGIASFTGAIFSRLAMGPACDLFGPRIASSTLSLLTAPIVLSVSLIQSPLSFILVRFLIGFCLANFVANQFWMSSMFSSNVVGLANGFAAGWANVGSGATQLLMPLIVSLLTDCFQIPTSTAWRAAFVVPAVFQSVTAILVLIYGQDLPDGNYSSKKNSRKTGGSGNNLFTVLFTGLRNYRGWILGLTYGYCFGVELTTDNIIAEYFYDRPAGGMVSDEMGRRFGMRGRLWSLWVVQTVAGLLCVLLGRVDSLWGSVVVMCCFSVFVQAASGLTFGVVPFVSKSEVGNQMKRRVNPLKSHHQWKRRLLLIVLFLGFCWASMVLLESQSSRIRTLGLFSPPYVQKPKIAFLFIARNRLQLDMVWDAFFQGDKENKFSIFVHSRPGFLFNKATTRSTYFLNRQVNDSIQLTSEKTHLLLEAERLGILIVTECFSFQVDWGEASMIRAERILLKHAFADPFNVRFLFLSDSCIPLYNFSYTYDYIMSAPTSFVDSFSDTKEGRYNPKMHPVIPLHNWRKGSQWVVLTRKHAEITMKDDTVYPMFQWHCKAS